MNTFHEFCGIISVDASAATVITSLRPEERGPFDDSDMLLLTTLMPHLQRAIALQLRIATLETAAASAMDVLDTLPYGIVLISADVKVLLVNRFAKAIIDQNDGLRVVRQNSDPECHFETPVQTLGHLFALSHAEARLAAVLIKGSSLREASEELSVSLSTVRTHLKKLFEKTGTNRQATLIRAFLMSPARLLSN
jgi:DNA-binding CsgD family transcriptional regulator